MFGLSDEIVLLLSFLLFMGFFAGVGLASMRVKQDTTDDYLVAGRGMHPALAALSAVSTWNSGYVHWVHWVHFHSGLFRHLDRAGLHPRSGRRMDLAVQIHSEGRKRAGRSLALFLVSKTTGAPEAKLAGILSVAFLSIYAAAQLVAGGVASGHARLVRSNRDSHRLRPCGGLLLWVVFEPPFDDAAQSCVMIVGSTILCYVAVSEVGGLSPYNSLKDIDPGMSICSLQTSPSRRYTVPSSSAASAWQANSSGFA